MHLAYSATPAPPRDRLLRIPDVERVAGIKKSTVYQLMREGKFPPCVRITRRLSAWPESAVLNWVQQRIRESDAPTSAIQTNGQQRPNACRHDAGPPGNAPPTMQKHANKGAAS